MSYEVEWATCPTKNCGYSPFPMDKGYRDRVKRTGERFICPAGHGIVFNGGLTADQKRIEELTREIVWYKADNEQLRDIRRRLEVTCQWIECGFMASSQAGLHTHMRARHGMPALAALRETG
jgi:hypothetical protein